MPLDPAKEQAVRAEAKRRGVDPDRAVAHAEGLADKSPTSEASKPDGSGDTPSRPVADRLLVGFLPFIKVRELRANWLGLDERIPDDEMTCGDYAAKHGGAAPASAEPPA